jgi:predicted unusual protein kinase regulating ubiquinone biosynthesis (AarF/ABC1/UbiB family)
LGSEAARRAHAEVLWTFVFRSLLVGGAFNADPHPGNYFFGAEGGVSFLDFGCVQLLPDSARRAAVMAHRGSVAGNRADFRAGMTELLQLRPGKFADAALRYVELCFAPIFDSPFRISREWAAQLTKAGQESKSEMLGKGANLTLPPAYLAMMNRLQFGFYSVLARFDVEVDYRAIEARIVAEAASAETGRIRDLVLGRG